MVTAAIPRLEAILSPLLVQYPYWQLAMHEAIGLYGYYMACKQESVNEFIEFLRSHPEDFRKEIVESEEFRNGFVLAFQDYLKLRTKEKRLAAKHIFLDFARSQEKSEFPIEQLDDALLKISIHSLRTLAFIKQDVLPLKEKEIRDRLKKKNIKDSGKSEDWWFELDWKSESTSKYISKWLYDNFHPSGVKMKERYGDTGTWEKKFLDDVFEEERIKRDEINVAIEEFLHLGILKMRITGGGGIASSAGAEYDFTELGYQFLEYVS